MSYSKTATLTAYDYDLISGKVNLVSYQPGFQDELYHRYEYDAENRLTDVYTTHRKAFVGDRTVEEREAAYQYYRHGPLARLELGNNKVQGVDYAYTLQGWLKGVNAVALNPAFDMGADGGNAASPVARDAFGFSLNYFMGDYKPIKATVVPFAEAGAYIGAPYKPLYNGNISNMASGIKGLKTMLYNYGYDQLNRLISMDAYQGFDSVSNQWSGIAAANKYGERITYDGNGNILTYNRDGNKTGASLAMDRLTYHYVTGTNKLDYIKDDVGDAVYAEDIDNQAAGNYGYDAIGNLTKDTKEQIGQIEWTVYGKISKIHKTNGLEIAYTYDASGNRISKTLSGTGIVGGRVTTWYARDAQGDTMTTYELKGGTVIANEQYLYGSSRVGVQNRNLALSSSLEIASRTLPVIGKVYDTELFRGTKRYELTDHRQNVNALISDRKKPVFSGSTVAYYEPEIVSAQDYYPGGMEMPGRSYQTGTPYRYSINGQEKTPEIGSNTTTAEFWQYDARILRRWNVDPKPNVAISPYNCFFGNPVWFSDPKGDTVRGASRSDASILRNDIKGSLAGNNFKKVRDLIKIDKDKVSISAISKDDLNKALNGVSLNTDEEAFLNGIVNTINSPEVHYAEYKDVGDMMSLNALTALNLDPNDANRRKIAAVLSNNMSVDDIPSGQLPAGYLKLLGGAATGKFGSGSYSIILNNPERGGSGYFSSKDNTSATSPNIRPTMHEIFGHGRLIALGIQNQHKAVIQFENLQLRIMGLNIYRDGSNHNTKPGEVQILTEEERNAIPGYLQNK